MLLQRFEVVLVFIPCFEPKCEVSSNLSSCVLYFQELWTRKSFGIPVVCVSHYGHPTPCIFTIQFITLVNTQNVSVTKIVDASSIQYAETKYGLRFSSWLYLSWYMKCGLMRKIVTWEGIHVSALRSQTVSNDVCWEFTLFLYSSATSARNYKEKRGLLIILTFHLLFDRYPTLKTSLFQYHCNSIF